MPPKTTAKKTKKATAKKTTSKKSKAKADEKKKSQVLKTPAKKPAAKKTKAEPKKKAAEPKADPVDESANGKADAASEPKPTKREPVKVPNAPSVLKGPDVFAAESADLLDQVDPEGLPKFVDVGDEIMATEQYVRRCQSRGFVQHLEPGSNEYVKGQEGAPVFIGYPYINPATSDHELVHQVTKQTLRLLFRDISGRDATNCAVYMLEEQQEDAE